MKKNLWNDNWTYYQESDPTPVTVSLPHDAMLHSKRDPFISYHRYCDCPEDFIQYIRDSNEIFAEYGYGDCEKHLNEWNYVAGWLGEVWKQSLRDEKSLKGASFVLSCICASQYEDVDVLCYYDARPCSMNGMFT